MGSIPTMSIPFDDSRGPYVLAMDIGSTASRGGLYDASGCPIKGTKQRESHEFTTGEGVSTIDADQVVSEITAVINGILNAADHHNIKDQIAAVALDSFASSLILVDGDGNALTPCITYADSRSAQYVEQLRAEIDEEAYHGRTGVRLHTSYHPSRLLWLKTEFEEEFNKAKYVMTIGEYVYFKLAGITGMATSIAAWSGILDAHTGELDLTILEHIGVDPALFGEIRNPDEPATDAKVVDKKWKHLEEIPWFHAIPDGWPSNIGPGAVDSKTVAVAAATSGAMRVILPSVPEQIPSGLWCYRVSRDQCIVGGALNDVGRAVTWLERTIIKPENLDEVLIREPLEGTPAVLPFFSGERSIGWAASAQATITNIQEQTGPEHLWRGVFEALALSYQRVWEHMEKAGAAPERVIASGRVSTDHPEFLAMLSDALDTPVIPLEMKRATLRGTALIVLEQLEPGGTRATPPFGTTHQPRFAHHYSKARELFDALYLKLV